MGVHAYLGTQLDNGGGCAGKARLLGLDNEGHPKEEFSRGGAAVKLRLSSTVLSYGEQRVKTPVFSSSDSRLLPETATGFFLANKKYPGNRTRLHSYNNYLSPIAMEQKAA
jgi:imipenem/basic amino acid-specific outer membrane pore